MIYLPTRIIINQDLLLSFDIKKKKTPPSDEDMFIQLPDAFGFKVNITYCDLMRIRWNHLYTKLSEQERLTCDSCMCDSKSCDVDSCAECSDHRFICNCYDNYVRRCEIMNPFVEISYNNGILDDGFIVVNNPETYSMKNLAEIAKIYGGISRFDLGCLLSKDPSYADSVISGEKYTEVECDCCTEHGCDDHVDR